MSRREPASWGARLVWGATLATVLAGAPLPLAAQQIGAELAARLSESQTRAYVLYLRGNAVYAREADAYWATIEELKALRRKKRSSVAAFAPDDFVAVQPPRYDGPPMPADVAKIIAELHPPEPPEPSPVVADFRAHAVKEYAFIATPTTEAQFKRHYAEEALSLGLSKDQVVRIYALETGGRGTYDMQAGIDPETKKGRPISSALGYAQLLGANSVDELVKHGDTFIARLNALAASPAGAARAGALKAKAAAVARMLRAARAVPREWSAHVAFARTPKGQGIHALNLDADIGPWLQAIKLRGIRDTADRAGRPNLTGAEIELMNLAGPQTGLDMMATPGRGMPTANFFTRKSYNRNPIVKDRTAAELLQALESRMNENMPKAGTQEFARAFDAVLAARQSASRR